MANWMNVFETFFKMNELRVEDDTESAEESWSAEEVEAQKKFKV